jgi:hypothetical protein
MSGFSSLPAASFPSSRVAKLIPSSLMLLTSTVIS